MTRRELKRRLRTAVEHTAGDPLDQILARCVERKGTVIPMKKRKFAHKGMIALAACLALVLLGGAAFGVVYQQQNSVASVVSLDVNPGVELRLNQNETVLAAEPLNDDAVLILEGMDLRGDSLDQAINTILGSLLRNGYVDELANSILITVEDDNLERGTQLQQRLSGEVEEILSAAKISGAILSQTLQTDETLQQQADAYGISMGKAALIQMITARGMHTFEELAGLSINELNLLVSTGGESAETLSGGNMVSSGTASQSAYIGQDAALSAAITAAGVDAAQVQVEEIELDYENGRMIYDVEFFADGVAYDWHVDALTGEAVADGMSFSGGNQVSNTVDVGEELARDAALAHAGAAVSDVSELWIQREYDDGRLEYEISFRWGTGRYEYKVDGNTGEILEAEIDLQEGAVDGEITMEQARAAALEAAGVTTAEVWDMEIERERKGTTVQYEVEFRVGNTEYTYVISGNDGSVVSTGTTGNNGTLIGQDAALSAALTHAGVSADQAYKIEVDPELDERVPHYSVEFHGGTMEYEYEIDAYTGAVLNWESDRED